MAQCSIFHVLLFLILELSFFHTSLSISSQHSLGRGSHNLQRDYQIHHHKHSKRNLEGTEKLRSPKGFTLRSVNGVERMLPPSNPTKRSVNRPRQSASFSGTVGYIQSTSSDGTVSYISDTLNDNGDFDLSGIQNALVVTLPSAAPPPRFLISSSLGFVGATVNPNKPLSSGTAYNTSQRLKKRVFSPASLLSAIQKVAYDTFQQVLVSEELVVNQIKQAQFAAVLAISLAAQSAFDIIAEARDAGVPVEQRDDPTLAADLTALNAFNDAAQTAANAAYLQAYTACVAADAAKTTAITAYAATLVDASLDSSIQIAADAAALAITTAASAAQGLDPVCSAQNLPILLALSGAQVQAVASSIDQAIIDNQNAILTANQNLKLSTFRLAKIKTLKLKLANDPAASNAATLTPSGEGVTWALDPDSKSLTAVYKNDDGGSVEPISFFLGVGNGIGVTGNLAAYSSSNPELVGPSLVLNFYPVYS